MAENLTISFVTTSEQLARVDAATEESDRTRSAMLRVLIDLGLDTFRAQRAQMAQLMGGDGPQRFAAETK